jgi:molecular chaperone DnaK (HSP70)
MAPAFESLPSASYKPQQGMQASFGVDLGTTNSVVASNGKVLPLHDSDGTSTLMPSVVAFLPNGGARVGNEARARRPVDPLNTLASTKRVIGESFTSYATRTYQAQYPYKLSAHPNGTVQFDTRAGAITPEEVATLIAAHLCMRAGTPPTGTKAVLTVPSSHRLAARKATVDAALKAGFGELRLIEEPVATAIAYLERASLRYGAVYDFGGGTFDFAIVDCSVFPFRVLGHAGDPYLGGDDVDRALADIVAAEILKQGWDVSSDPATFARLVLAVERAKCALMTCDEVPLDIASVDAAAPSAIASLHVTRSQLDAATVPLIRRTFGIVDEVLSDVKLQARDVQAVFLAGGSTRLPMLPNFLSEYFGKRVRRDLNPEHVVATGASIAAARPHLWPLLDSE